MDDQATHILPLLDNVACLATRNRPNPQSDGHLLTIEHSDSNYDYIFIDSISTGDRPMFMLDLYRIRQPKYKYLEIKKLQTWLTFFHCIKENN